jgi:hypothetical protein
MLDIGRRTDPGQLLPDTNPFFEGLATAELNWRPVMGAPVWGTQPSILIMIELGRAPAGN